MMNHCKEVSALPVFSPAVAGKKVIHFKMNYENE